MSGTEASYLTVSPDSALTEQATELGLRLPTIQIADKLQRRLSRVDRILEVDQQCVWAGVREAEVEHDVTVSIGSLPKDTDLTDPIITYYGYSHTVIDADSKPTPGKESTRKLNEAFWLGVLVTDGITSGSPSKLESTAARIRGTQSRRKAFTALVCGGIALFADCHILGTDIHGWLLAAEGLTVDIVTTDLVWGRLNRRFPNTTLTKMVQAKKTNAARDLAERYPSLPYAAMNSDHIV